MSLCLTIAEKHNGFMLCGRVVLQLYTSFNTPLPLSAPTRLSSFSQQATGSKRNKYKYSYLLFNDEKSIIYTFQNLLNQNRPTTYCLENVNKLLTTKNK